MKTKSIIISIAIAVLVVVVILLFFNSASIRRAVKSAQSEYTGGLDRTVTVYDYSGKEIKEYKGKIDIEESAATGKVKFDLDGKRTIIYGGIVIVQED